MTIYMDKEKDMVKDIERTLISSTKQNRKKRYLENINKGLDYEIQICDFLKAFGYEINPTGLYNGRDDKGIDIVAKRGNQILFVQCKNWKEDGRKISHKHIKEFIGNCEAYKNQKETSTHKYINVFITSNHIIDKSAQYFLKENDGIIKYRVVSYKEE